MAMVTLPEGAEPEGPVAFRVFEASPGLKSMATVTGAGLVTVNRPCCHADAMLTTSPVPGSSSSWVTERRVVDGADESIPSILMDAPRGDCPSLKSQRSSCSDEATAKKFRM